MNEDIARYFEEQSDWRAEKANEFPEDVRNLQAATKLHELADLVRRLPEVDERCGELRELLTADDCISPYADTAAMLARFGFNDPRESPDAFISAVLTAARREAAQFAESAL